MRYEDPCPELTAEGHECHERQEWTVVATLIVVLYGFLMGVLVTSFVWWVS